MYAILDLIKELYHPRTCNLPLKEEEIGKGKYKVCLDYHIKRCGGPCVGKQSREEYMANINQAKEILKGKTRDLLRKMREDMMALAEDLKFEEAELLKRKYEAILSYCSKSEVVSHTIDNVDVFSITNDGNTAFINFIHVNNGAINQSFTFEYKKKLDETDEELLALGIVEMRKRFNSKSKEIILPIELDLDLDGITITVPQRGDKKTLLDLSIMNGKQYKFDRLKQKEKLNPEQKAVRLMTELQQALKLPHLPYQIECFDNSNISGTNAVAACIVFKKMKPSKSDYRKYNIKTVVGPDDYASMKEVVRRRYERLKEENERLPELLYGFPPITIGLKTDSELFQVLTRIQDEVHRFAITFHRDKRSKAALHSELDDIKGIGPKTKELLLEKLKTVKKIKETSHETLAEIVGESKAKLITEFFDAKKEQEY